MTQVQKILAQYGVAAAFVVLAFFGGWAIKVAGDNQTDRLLKQQIEGCERVNVVRQTLGDFLADAAKARRYDKDWNAARRFEAGVAQLQGVSETPGDSVQVDCKKAYPPL